MLKSILVGAFLTLITVGIHGLGTSWWIRRLRRLGTSDATPELSPRAGLGGLPLRILTTTALFLLLLHILEVSVWACVYLLLPDLNELNTLEEATYFSTVTFSSLGYGDMVLGGSWRLLSAIQAMTGLLIFGWSSALVFGVVQRLWQIEEQS